MDKEILEAEKARVEMVNKWVQNGLKVLMATNPHGRAPGCPPKWEVVKPLSAS